MTDDHGLPPVCWFCGDRHRVSDKAGYLANCRVPTMQKRLEGLLAEKERLEALLREDRDFITSKGLFEEFWQFAADRAAPEHGGEEG